MTQNGIILKGIGGFYYVEAAGVLYECKARGVFRKQGITPTVGDFCTVTVQEKGSAVIDSIEERRNNLVRPAISNLDKLFIVASSTVPQPNTLVLDRLTALAVHNDIEPYMVFTKLDLGDMSAYRKIYESAKIRCIMADYEDGSFIDELKDLMKDCTSAFAGNSGVGKSTLINAIAPELTTETGEVSEKLGRGRHTTRSVELYTLPFGGRLADTPGFSSFDIERGMNVKKDELAACFPEFADLTPECRFTSCSHTCEKGCAVVAAVKCGAVSRSRHESYKALYEEAKSIKDWENK